MTPRPVIGITAYSELARWGAWKLPATLLPAAYAQAVSAAGGAPVLLPPTAHVEDALPHLDGLLLSGGADVDPALYGAEPDPATTNLRGDRDASELALLSGALERELPLLAVCRGMQLLNVVRGGTLEQHVPDRVGHDGHLREPGRFSTHPVAIAPGSRLHTLLGARVEVPSHHHQAVDRLGAGLLATAHAQDGTPEAIELPGRRLVLGVQWHPEAGEDARLFEALVRDARAAVAERTTEEVLA